MKKALNEARTIIDQQQNQLTEFRRLAAQYQTDTEAFKVSWSRSFFSLSLRSSMSVPLSLAFSFHLVCKVP
ncbi:unnamed protein product [Trichobilharzia regenti]|nr:unnamed protein product [Trichobilharzia regenti]